MLTPSPRLQPSYYEAFRCVGSVCEDTCCRGWRVSVDKETFQKYQTCSHANLGPKLRTLVNINPASENDNAHAEIELDRGACPFHADGLCEIQATLGGEMLSKNCATYPRVMATVEGRLERSLDLSCPEAARLALTNSQPIEFAESSGDEDESRLGSIGILDTANSKYPDKPFRYVHEVRSLMISLLQNRGYPLSQRILVLGRLCDKLETEGTDDGCTNLRAIIRQPAPVVPRLSMPAPGRFETVVELILARIGSDSTSRRFLDCYQSFMAGLHWTKDSTMEELAARLDAAFAGPYAVFLAQHQHMLEHYLVSYVFRSLFPFGSQSLNRKLAEYRFAHSISRHYQLMVVDFVVIETLLAGLAAFHGARFGVPEALKLIQSATKTFEHSLSYPGKALDLLIEKGIDGCASMSMLIRD
jgi:lysine-N-methylase